MTRDHSKAGGGEDQLDACLAAVREAIGKLDYGTITLTIHQGEVVQMDVTEKQRIQNSKG